MSSRNRIKPKLEYLPPSSVIKIFLFLRRLIERENLDLKFFESRKQLFNLEELYFVEYYAKKYLDNSDSKNYLSNWISIQEKYIDNDFELFESFSNFLDLIENNSIEILKKIDWGIAQRLSDYHFATSFDGNNDNYGIVNLPIEYKIRLLMPPYKKIINKEWGEELRYFRSPKIDDFEKFFNNSLKHLLSENEINQFFYNSFSFFPNYNETPGFLDLKVLNKRMLEKAMFDIFDEYNKNFVKLRPYKNKKPNDVSDKRWKYSRKLKRQDSTKADLIKIMYNAFPYIRKDYFDKKKKDISLRFNQFANNRISNIRNK